MKGESSMKIYVIKAFDVSNFRLIQPVSAFSNKESAEIFCELNNSKEGSLFFAYDEVTVSNMTADEIKATCNKN